MAVIIPENYREEFSDYSPQTLESRIKSLSEDGESFNDGEIQKLLCEFIVALERGDIRAAEKQREEWQANAWVKKGILEIFGHAENVVRKEGRDYYDVMPTRNVEEFKEKGARNTPGTTLRVGNFFGEGATVMSEAYVNIGVYVGDGSMVDSNVTTGSCAQIGDDVHVGANSLIGGVLEPVEDNPVIIEDGASIGGGSVVTSGFRVGKNVEVAENTLLTPRITVYDIDEEGNVEEIKGHIPEGRRAFQRYESSGLGKKVSKDLMKPCVVAIPKDQDEVELEETLRMD